MIAIVDYGLGNLGSILNMLKLIGEKAIITSDIEKIENADKIILPGVGSFDMGMNGSCFLVSDMIITRTKGKVKNYNKFIMI